MSEIGDRDRAGEEAAGNAAVAGLDRVLADFDEYYRRIDESHQGRFNEQAVDVRKRLRQARLVLRLLNAALEESRSIMQEADAARDAASSPHDEWAGMTAFAEVRRRYIQRSGELLSLIELHSETFYWIAARAMKAATYLPGLKSFTAPGVRDVRNHLIEHPEGKSSGVFNGGFGYGKPRGPVLGALRTSETPDVWHDAGLFVNVDEFADRFCRALQAAQR